MFVKKVDRFFLVNKRAALFIIIGTHFAFIKLWQESITRLISFIGKSRVQINGVFLFKSISRLGVKMKKKTSRKHKKIDPYVTKKNKKKSFNKMTMACQQVVFLNFFCFCLVCCHLFYVTKNLNMETKEHFLFN